MKTIYLVPQHIYSKNDYEVSLFICLKQIYITFLATKQLCLIRIILARSPKLYFCFRKLPCWLTFAVKSVIGMKWNDILSWGTIFFPFYTFSGWIMNISLMGKPNLCQWSHVWQSTLLSLILMQNVTFNNTTNINIFYDRYMSTNFTCVVSHH